MALSAYRTLLEHELDSNTRSIISITKLMVADARQREASDIHIDPTPGGTRIRLRINGLLSDKYDLPSDCHAELIARLKILARLRTDEHFSPQDGRFTFVVPHTSTGFDIRISVMPTQYGESVVLRLLTPPKNGESLIALGMETHQEELASRVLDQSDGFVLVVGPTGSGKTTTLYTLLRKLISTDRSIVSIEDPIEYSVPGMRQVQVVPSQGLTFAEGLRSILRQDPDIIMVGEIRDMETANLAIGAAHTGHLVLSTLHARGAAGAFARLQELGVAETRLKSIRPLIISQKLVRAAGEHGRHAEFTLLYEES